MQPVAPQLFLSHARVDARLVARLERILTVWGGRPWVDRQQIGGGQEWPIALQQAIDQSAALLVVLTPHALRSVMVRREYLYALSRRIPVMLVRYRGVTALPPELANLPMVDFQTIAARYGPALYMLLADRGLIPPPAETQLDTIHPDAIHRVWTGRVPADWRVWQLPRSTHLWLGLLPAVFSVALIALAFAPVTWIEQLYRNVPGVFNTLVSIATPGAAIFIGLILVVPATLHLNAALGRGLRETIVLTPDSVTVELHQRDRLRFIVQPHRYHFRFVRQVTVRRLTFGRVSIGLEDAATQRNVRIVLPWYWPDHDTIAQQIAQAFTLYQQHATQTRNPAQAAKHLQMPAPADPVAGQIPALPSQQPAAIPAPAPYPYPMDEIGAKLGFPALALTFDVCQSSRTVSHNSK